VSAHSLWDQHSWQLIGVVLLCAVQASLIVALLLSRARRKRSEESLRRSDARNRALLSALPDLMFLQTRDGVYLDFYARDEGDLLVTPKQFLGKRSRDVLPPDLCERFEQAFELAIATGGPALVEYTLTIHGNIRHFEARVVQCEPDAMLSIVRDITDRRHFEEALRQSQERYSLATTSGRVGVWEWDPVTGEMFIDPAVKAMLGYSADELPDRAEVWSDILHPDDRERVSEEARAHLEGRTPIFETEVQARGRDGTYVWFLVRAVMLERARDGSRRMVGTTMDISERRHAEAALREAQNEVDRLSRLTAMGELTASIAHEVSQPLCAIVANAQASLRWLPADETQALTHVREALRDIVADANRANEVVQRTRRLFTHRPGGKASIDINSVVEEVIGLAKRSLEHAGATVRTDLAAGLPLVHADGVLLQQVLLNLIMNGIEAMAPDGEPTIVIRTSAAETGGVLVAVSDTGTGLQTTEVVDVFEPLRSTKPDGMGMGLAISRAIVVAHGGRLWAEPNDGPGATFRFDIPGVEQTSPEIHGSPVNA
jgi:PAS domain S-box-containing protein